MANLKTIRKRIESVKSTQKITRAMKMVAAAKLRRAQEGAESFRAYADLTSSILGEVASDAGASDHPLLQRRAPAKKLIVVIASDRGLCGGFNSNLCREAFAHIKQQSPEPAVALIGRKAADYFSHREVTVDKKYKDVYEHPGYETAASIARELAQRYADGEVDQIELAFNQFVSIASQKPTVRPLLPVVLPDKATESGGGEWVTSADFIYEPSGEELLERLLPRYVEVQVHRAILESIAAEHAARMTAMDNATKNAGEMIDHLTLIYNRKRQSSITSELMDIVGGAEALND